MKKMVLGLLGVLGLLLVALVGLIAVQPADFRFQRSATVAAPASAVFPLVNDFHLWDQWSPWAKLDPAMKTSYEGPATGVGAIYTWSGDSTVGEGKMTILESSPNESIGIQLEFVKPMEATNTAAFTFKEENGQTTVTWTMSGRNNFVGKAFGFFVDMDAMLGAQFEQGLAAMKSAAESAATAAPATGV